MAEYIKREELNKWLDDLEVIYQSAEPVKPIEEIDISELLKCVLSKHFDDLPSIDIVHCKECKYWAPHKQCGNDADYDEYHNYCKYHMPDDEWYAEYWEADDYCSDGKRKEKSDG